MNTGDIIEITYSHPVLGSGVFYPKAGGTRDIKFIQDWKCQVTIIWDNDGNDSCNDLKTLTAIKESDRSPVWVMTHINGSIWAGNGTPEFTENPELRTIELTINGIGKLRKIA